MSEQPITRNTPVRVGLGVLVGLFLGFAGYLYGGVCDATKANAECIKQQQTESQVLLRSIEKLLLELQFAREQIDGHIANDKIQTPADVRDAVRE